jgi:DNA-binding CsgD family transcriptional regulator
MLSARGQDRTISSGADSAPRIGGLPEIAHGFRQAAQEAGAEGFSLFTVSCAADDRPVTPLMDSAYPRMSKRTELLALLLGDRFARRAKATTQPCWWAGDDDWLIAASLTRCLWAERVPAPDGMPAALVLPLVDENNHASVVVLWGNRIALSMPALADMQARCLSLFARLVRLQPQPARAAPPISRRELECLRLTANGQTSEEIAATLGLSVHTANQYLTNSTQKLNAMNRMHAVAKALRLGLIE